MIELSNPKMCLVGKSVDFQTHNTGKKSTKPEIDSTTRNLRPILSSSLVKSQQKPHFHGKPVQQQASVTVSQATEAFSSGTEAISQQVDTQSTYQFQPHPQPQPQPQLHPHSHSLQHHQSHLHPQLQPQPHLHPQLQNISHQQPPSTFVRPLPLNKPYAQFPTHAFAQNSAQSLDVQRQQASPRGRPQPQVKQYNFHYASFHPSTTQQHAAYYSPEQQYSKPPFPFINSPHTIANGAVQQSSLQPSSDFNKAQQNFPAQRTMHYPDSSLRISAQSAGHSSQSMQPYPQTSYSNLQTTSNEYPYQHPSQGTAHQIGQTSLPYELNLPTTQEAHSIHAGTMPSYQLTTSSDAQTQPQFSESATPYLHSQTNFAHNTHLRRREENVENANTNEQRKRQKTEAHAQAQSSYEGGSLPASINGDFYSPPTGDPNANGGSPESQDGIPSDISVPGELHVKGLVRAKAFLQYSDLRFKTNVDDIVDALEIVSKLQGKLLSSQLHFT